MSNNPKLVWYASYGSNMSQDRFNCYISGGKPKGSTKTYKGCTDKTPAIKSQAIRIPGSIYFAKKSKTWHNGGVAFLNTDTKGSTPGRMHLITEEQFDEVLYQETGSKNHIKPDLNIAINEGHLIIRPESWYGKVVFLGNEDGIPIFTFTNSIFLEQEINEPNIDYVNTIRVGLMETWCLNEQEIDCYLADKKGIL